MRNRKVSIVALHVFINNMLAVHSLVVSSQWIHHQIHQRIYQRRSVTPNIYSSRWGSLRDETLTPAAAARALDLNSAQSSDIDITRGSSIIFTQSAEDVYSILVGLEPASRDDDATRAGDLLLGIEDITRGWVELDELLVDGEISSIELDQLYTKSLESSISNKLDKKGFFVLYQSIDDLFEPGDQAEDDDDVPYQDVKEIDTRTEVAKEESSPSATTDPPAASSKIMKEKLLSVLTEVDTNNYLSCGFDCTDEEREVIHHLIGLLETNGPSDLVLSKRGKIQEDHLMGEWNLRYTSSRDMLINKSLSGLGRSTSTKAQFQGLVQRLGGTKYLGKAEYIETFGGEGASFDVVVTGDWFLEEKRHAFPRMPSSTLRVNPAKLTYGLITNQADEWASLGPIKLLDILYLDDNLMILRGNVNLKSFFIYQRIGTKS